MLTRKQIEADYVVDTNGVIRSPGKFEGSFLAVAYFYDAWLNGDGEEFGGNEDDAGTTLFDIDGDDVAQFPEFASVTAVTLFEDNNGFVYLAVLETPADVERFTKQFECEE